MPQITVPPVAEGTSIEVKTPPRIVVATVPTELINFDGKPDYKPAGSRADLLYATNCDGYVLVHETDTYVLASGRWFKLARNRGCRFEPAPNSPFANQAHAPKLTSRFFNAP